MEDFYTKKIGIFGLNNGRHHIGDSIVFSSFPENFYLNFKNKVIDMDKYWIFDNNPYVQRDIQPDIAINLPDSNIELDNIFFENIVAKINYFGEFKLNVYLNKPNLYIHEKINKEKSICIHLSGRSFNQGIPQEVIDYILNKYKTYTIYQIGGNSDKIINGCINKLGLPIKDTAEIIAKSEIFIGVNSGMMHLANCYSNVIKKIIINQPISEDKLSTGSIRIPQSKKFHIDGFDWLYLDNDHYNVYNQDIGITKSYLNI